ncbi:MAG TPA: hypothetical protein VH114_13110, partial [Candidatus Acidoferrum sp.]|nr:hypothetical protein [Candidatus Acidoferrum sp.]
AVAHALVFSADNRFAKLTDAEGHFEFKVPRPQEEQNAGRQISYGSFSVSSGPGRTFSGVISPGGIVLLARKPGYFQSMTGEPWTAAETESSAEIKIELVPEALIVGGVNLPSNDGTDKIQVQVYRLQVQEGHRQWAPAGSVSSRANGEFRIASLREGEYKLFTQELLDRDPLTFNPRGQLFGYPPVYYPAAADFESAAVIHLKAGEGFSATLTPSRREYYPVKLGVLNAEAGRGIRIEVQSQGHRGPGLSLGYNMNESSIEGTLPNGNYSVVVTAFGENGATGALNFSVSGAPVQGPSVMLVPNQLIEALVKDERTKGDDTIAPGARNLLGAMNVKLVPSEEFGQRNVLWLRPPKNPEDESLAFGNAHPASYRVRAGCNSTGYVAAVSSGGRDLLRQPLVVGIGAAVPPIEITIRDDGAQVQGSIENWPPEGRKEPMRNFSGNVPAVVLLPLPDSLGQFCQAWATPTGEFSFRQVPPGDYLALALHRIPEELEYGDTEAMKKYESKAQVLRLVPGQNEHLRLALNTGNE